MAAECSIPVIDLNDFPNQLPKLISACEDWGCFRLLNYDRILPATLMSEMKSVVRSFLDSPVEIKRRNVTSSPEVVIWLRQREIRYTRHLDYTIWRTLVTSPIFAVNWMLHLIKERQS